MMSYITWLFLSYLHWKKLKGCDPCKTSSDTFPYWEQDSWYFKETDSNESSRGGITLQVYFIMAGFISVSEWPTVIDCSTFRHPPLPLYPRRHSPQTHTIIKDIYFNQPVIIKYFLWQVLQQYEIMKNSCADKE